MLAAAVRAAATRPPARNDEREAREAREAHVAAHEHRNAVMRADEMRALRLTDVHAMLAKRAFGEPLHNIVGAPADAATAMAAAAAADAPLLATAREVAEAFGASNPDADMAAAVTACAALFDARTRAAAAARIERPPNALFGPGGFNGRNAWNEARAALDVAAAAAVCGHHAQLAAALRLPVEHGGVAVPDAAALPRLRDAVRGVEHAIAQLVRVSRAPELHDEVDIDAVAAAVTALTAQTAALTAMERAMNFIA